MMRAALLMVMAGFCQGQTCQGDKCPVMFDTSNLIQKHKSVADYEFEGEPDGDGSGWSFENSFLDNLIDKLSPDSISEQISNINISMQSAQDKIFGLADDFGSRLNETVEAAQDRLDTLQDAVYEGIEKGRMLKDQGIVEAVTMITDLGEGAVDVAKKVTADVEEGQLKVRQMVTMLKSEKVESKRREMQLSLDVAVNTLTGLEHALQAAMRKGDNADADLMQLDANATLNSSQPDVTKAAIERAEHVLQQTDKLLDDAKVYIEFVETRVDAAREEARRLVDAANNKTDGAFDLGNTVAKDVMNKLTEIDLMLEGHFSVIDAKVILSHNSAAQAAVSVLVCLFLASVVA